MAKKLQRTAKPTEPLVFAGGVAALIAAEPAEQGKGPDRFSMVLYTGATFAGHWYYGDVILDVAGFQAQRQDVAALNIHNPDEVVGWTEKIAADASAGTITASGRLLAGDTELEPAAALVRGRLAQGYPYQASGAWTPASIERVQAGATAKVNGKTVNGPVTIFRKFTIAEASFTPVGWDGNTNAVAASRPQGDEGLSKEETTQMKLNVLATLKDLVGAEKAIELMAAKPDAEGLDAFAVEINDTLKATRAELATVKTALQAKDQEIATLRADLEKAKAAPVVATASGDPSKPTVPAAGSATGKDAWMAEFKASADLQAEFGTVERFVAFKEFEARKAG